MRVVLDTNIISKLCHPKNLKNKAFVEAFIPIIESGRVEIYLPEIADYELRRKILHMKAKDSSWAVTLDRLDTLKKTLSYLEIDTDIFLQAAQNWADAKNKGKQTSADNALDGDSILAAQAASVGGKVVTENERHLSLFCEVLKLDSFIDEANKVIAS